jgi:hypothetical protein
MAMILPAPRDQLAGCVWLARIVAKARLLQRGELPPDYAERFCCPTGVDRQFLTFFGLTREEILAIAARPDAEVIAWFLTRSPDPADRIAAWNRIAVNLGRPGFPLAERFVVAKTTSYRHIDSRGMTTVFELLEADDQLTA